MKKQHSNCMSKTYQKSINHSKYLKVTRTKPIRDLSQDYDIKPTGWTRKRVQGKSSVTVRKV